MEYYAMPKLNTGSGGTVRNGSPRIGTVTTASVRSRQAGVKVTSGQRTTGDASKPIIPITAASGGAFGVGPKLTNDRVRSAYSGPSGPTAGAYMRGTTQSGAELVSPTRGRSTNPRSGRRAGVGGQTALPQAILDRGPKRRTTRKTPRKRSFS